MKLIALFLPAVITLGIRRDRSKGKEWKLYDYIKEYVISVLINVFMTQSVISYVLGLGGVDSTAFESFPFFTKYIFIACVLAFLIAYIREILNKYITVSFEIGDENEK